MDRHVYAWRLDDGAAGRRLPGAGRRPDQGRVGRPARPTRSPSTPTPAPSSRGRSSTRPRSATSTTATPRTPGDRRRHQRGVRRARTAAERGARERRLVQPARPARRAIDASESACGEPATTSRVPLNRATRASTRSTPTATTHPPRGEPFLPGWPAGRRSSPPSCCPSSARGSPAYPVIGPVTCPAAAAARRSARSPTTAPRTSSTPTASPATARAERPADIALQTDSASAQPARPPAGAGGRPSGIRRPRRRRALFLAPAAGLSRALDLALPEYQPTGQDFLAVWNDAGAGQFRPGFPATVNDLQFLTGPSVADLDGLPGEEIVEGTASKDLVAFNAAGAAGVARAGRR